MTTYPLKCETCGAPESEAMTGRTGFVTMTIFDCGAIVIPHSTTGKWTNFAPCPMPLIRALQAVANCGNTCLVCQREIREALETVK